MSIPTKRAGQVLQGSALVAGTANSSIPESGVSREASAAIAEILVDISEAVGDVNWMCKSWRISCHDLAKGTYYEIAYSALLWDKDSRHLRKEKLAELADSFSNGTIPRSGLDEWEW